MLTLKTSLTDGLKLVYDYDDIIYHIVGSSNMIYNSFTLESSKTDPNHKEAKIIFNSYCEGYNDAVDNEIGNPQRSVLCSKKQQLEIFEKMKMFLTSEELWIARNIKF